VIELKSKTLCSYYGDNPSEYYLKFIHHNIDVMEDSVEEYKKMEEDFENIYNFDKNSFMLYFSDIQNYIKVVNHINIQKLYKDKIYLRIRSIDEYIQLKDINKAKKVKIIVDISDINKMDIIDLDLILQVDKISEISITKLNELLKQYRIKGILLGQIPCLTKQDTYLYEIMSQMYGIDSSKKLELEKINKITNDIYSVKDFMEILNKFNEVLKELNIENQLDGFYKIFNYIANTLSYDNDGVINTKIENQNLIGPVLNEKGVCEGYSKYLQQMLSLIGIEAIVVQGGSSKEEGGHVWNQVLIDNKWYNADVTYASYNINHNEEISSCLVKDDALLYQSNTAISHRCDENF